MVAWPDPSTFSVLPGAVAPAGPLACSADIRTPDGNPFPGDPRNVLKKVAAKAEALGYTMYVGPELEFFYFQDKPWHDRPRPGRLLRPHHPRRR